MPLPASWPTVLVYGTYLRLDGTPNQGSIWFETDQPVVVTDAAGVTIGVVPRRQVATLDNNGHFEIELPVTDAGALPTGWTYQVTEQINGGQAPYSIELTSALVPTGLNLVTAVHAYPVLVAPPVSSPLVVADLGVSVARQSDLVTAQNTANSAASAASTALTTATNASTAAATAQTAANAAQSTANAAQTAANAAQSDATTALANAATAQSAANAAQSDATTALANAATASTLAQLAPFKNKLINGNFDFWQRGTSFSGVAYTTDRWQCAAVGSTGAYSRQSFAINQTDVPGGPAYFLRTVVTSVAGSGNSVGIVQKVEDVRLLAGQTVTVSFWAKADAARSIGIGCTQDFGGGSPQNALVGQAVALTTAWKKYTVTFAIPAIGSNTFGASAPGWTGFRFYYDAGSSLSSAAGGIGQQSGTFDLAQVQVEVGSIATQFEARPFALELVLCQRYYEKSYDLSVATGGTGVGSKRSLARTVYLLSDCGNTQFRVSKRATPSVVIYAAQDGTSGNTSEYNAAGTFVANRTAVVFNISTSGFQVQQNANATADLQYAFHWSADAEL